MSKKVSLTMREHEIVALIMDSPDLKTLSARIGISYRTLQWHLSKLYAKFGVKNKFQLVMRLIEIDNNFKIR